MPKNKFLLSTTAIILVALGAFAKKLSVKSYLTTIYVSTSAGGCAMIIVNTSILFTTGGFGNQTTIKSSGGLQKRRFWGTSTCGSTGLGGTPVTIHFHG